MIANDLSAAPNSSSLIAAPASRWIFIEAGECLRAWYRKPWKGHLMTRLLQLKKANHGINLASEVFKNLMRIRLLPLPLMRKSMRTLHLEFLSNKLSDFS